MAYTVGQIDDAIEDFISIAAEGLQSPRHSDWQLYLDRVGRENVRGVYDGPRLAGGMAFYRMGIWFGGKPIPCAGFSGVAISPVDRGTGACGTMLRSLLQEMRAEGVPLASLYASTQYLYRTVGFEHAGSQTQYAIPIASISQNDRSVPIHRMADPPREKLNFVADVRAARTNGNLGRTEGLWQRLINPYDGLGSTTYLIGDIDQPEGYAIFRPGKLDGAHNQPLVSTDIAANTPRALERLLALVRDHRSTCATFLWFGAPNDPLHFRAREQDLEIKHFMRWMLRIVDVAGALTSRGYAPDANGELHLEIVDDVLADNAGRWVLKISNGSATLEPGGDGHLAMDIRSLAPLYSSLYSCEQLVQYGAIHATDEHQIRQASRLFEGPAPWVPELY